jgi:dihydroorotase
MRRLTVNPASVLGRDAGHLSVGGQADICIFDPQDHWTVSASQLFSQGSNTPYLGLELQGRVQSVLVDGRCVFERANGGFSASSR